MQKSIRVITLTIAALGLGVMGCTQTGMFGAMHVTTTELGGNNFRVLAQSVDGQSSAGYLLGVSYPLGGLSSSFALARIQGTGKVYQEALDDLWANFELEHGPIGERKLALANVRFDSDHLNLLVYTSATISIRADIVEFIAE